MLVIEFAYGMHVDLHDAGERGTGGQLVGTGLPAGAVTWAGNPTVAKWSC